MSHHTHVHSTLPSFFRRAIFDRLRILVLAVLLIQVALVYAVNAPQPSRRVSLSTVTAQDNQECQLLEPGKPPIKHELSGGDKGHQYCLTLKAGQYVHIVVEQQGIDVLVRLFGPGGKQVAEVDTESQDGTQGPENVRAVAETTGDYRLWVDPLVKDARPGHYEVRIEEQRATASNKDKNVSSAERALMEAKHLLSKKDEESQRKAAAKFEEAAGFRHAAGESKLAGETFYIAADLYSKLHNQQKAFESFERARSILQRERANPILAASLVELGKIYASLNYLERALDKYKEALDIFQSLGLRREMAAVYNNMGNAYESLGNKEEALKYYKEKALPILLELKSLPNLPIALSNLGHLYYSMNRPEEALTLYNEALPIFQAMENDESLRREGFRGEAITLSNIGQVIGGEESTRGKAFEAYERARSIFQALQETSLEISTLGNMGSLYELSDRKEEALKSYLEAIGKAEYFRGSLTLEELRAGLVDPLALVYKASRLYMSKGQDEQAFNLTELARARSFLDQVGNARLDALQTTDVQLIEEREKLEADIENLETELGREGGARPEAAKEYEAAQRLYEELLIRYKLANPAYASVRNVKPLDLAEVQRRLDEDTTILSYFMSPDETFAFVISKRSFRRVTIQVKEEELIKEIGWFRAFPNLRNSEAAAAGPPDVTLRRLYDRLIAPVKPYLRTQKVAIVPHRELHFLSFAALTDGSHYFGEQHTLFYLPSVSALRAVNSKASGSRMLALAQRRAAEATPLQYADAEAETIARLYNTRPLTTGKTSKSAFLKLAPNYTLIHIAAHAQQNTVSPLFYGVSLGAGEGRTEKLEVREIYQLNLSKASLVVLSACHSSWGVPTQGDDIIALDRAFLQAGASTVIASLWLVDDKSTSELMASFYKYLKNGMSKAEALRAAQSDTRRKKPDPFYWASFVLTGDPGR